MLLCTPLKGIVGTRIILPIIGLDLSKNYIKNSIVWTEIIIPDLNTEHKIILGRSNDGG